MKFRLFLSLLVVVLAGIIVYFDAGITGSAVSFAAVLPLFSVDFEGEDNLPGVARGYIIRANEITTEAKPIASPVTALDAITIVGSHVLAAEKYFSRMYTTLGKATLKYESEGSRDFENFKITGSLFYPSTKKEALAMSAAILGQDLIILLEENSESDHFLQVGTKKLPARVVSSGDWGTELNGEKGITYNIEAFHGKKPPYVYTGSILLGAENDVNPQAGG